MIKWANMRRLRRPSTSRVATAFAVALVWAGQPVANVASATTAVRAASAWSVKSPPYPAGAGVGPSSGQIVAESCASSVFCVGVGNYILGSNISLPDIVVVAKGVVTSFAAPLPKAMYPGNEGFAALNAVACPAVNECVAIGTFAARGDGVQAFAVVDRNGAWSAGQLPTITGVNSGSRITLASISCESATTCVAVGGASSDPANEPTTPEVLVDSGGKWTAHAVSDPGSGGQLDAVSCAGASCVAVGRDAPTVADTSDEFASVESGGSWTSSVLPLPADIDYGSDEFTSISCPSPGTCTAAGDYLEYDGTQHEQAMVDSLSGGSWTTVGDLLPTVSDVDITVPTAISCSSATTCTVIGNYNDGGGPGFLLVEVSGTWSMPTTPLTTTNPNRSDAFMGLACTGSTCVIVGAESLANVQMRGAILVGGGTTWHLREEPAPTYISVFDQYTIDTVACPAVGRCTAMGDDDGFNFVDVQHGGTWAQSAVPVPATQVTGTLSDVACPLAGHCVATESSPRAQTGVADSALVTQSGTAWRAQWAPVPAGAPAGSTANVWSVSCASASFCVAVGGYGVDGVGNAVAERWNGKTWTATKVLAPQAGGHSYLGTVTCPSTTSCVASGGTVVSNTSRRAWIASFNGHVWGSVRAPVPASPSVTVDGIACGSPTQCGAIVTEEGGKFYFDDGYGTHWSAASYSPPHAVLLVSSTPTVSCSSVACVSAVDSAPTVNGVVGEILTEAHGHMSVVTAPVPHGAALGQQTRLGAVSCIPTGECTIVGQYENSEGATVGLILMGSGSKWHARAAHVPAHNSESESTLGAVSCVAGPACSATGSFTQSNNVNTVELVSITAGSSSAVPAPTPTNVRAVSLELNQISCAPGNRCAVTGSYFILDGPEEALLEISK